MLVHVQYSYLERVLAEIIKSIYTLNFTWMQQTIYVVKDWSQFFCLVHEEITSIGLYTQCNPRTQGCVQPDWGYFEWTEQIISTNPYKLIQTFVVILLKNIFVFSK